MEDEQDQIDGAEPQTIFVEEREQVKPLEISTFLQRRVDELRERGAFTLNENTVYVGSSRKASPQAEAQRRGENILQRVQTLGLLELPEFAMFRDRAWTAEITADLQAAIEAVSRKYCIDPEWMRACIEKSLVGPPALCVRDAHGVLRVVTGHLGTGGIGSVWASANAEEPNRHSAIKFILLSGPEGEAVARSCAEEGEALRSIGDLEGYGNVDGPDGSYHVTIMPYKQGPTVRELLRIHPVKRPDTDDEKKKESRPDYKGNLPLRLATEIVLQTAKKIREARRLHLDIKPSNLLVDIDISNNAPTVAVHVIDWGSSMKEPRPVPTLTLEYAAPEQFPVTSDENEGQISLPTHNSDVYALGATLYELVAGDSLFNVEKNTPLQDIARTRRRDDVAARLMERQPRGEDRGHPAGRDPFLQQLTLNDVPEPFRDGGKLLRETLLKAVQRRSSDRYSMDQLIDALEEAKKKLWGDENPGPLVHEPRGAKETHTEYHERIARNLLQHFEFADFKPEPKPNGGSRSPSGSRTSDTAAPGEEGATSRA